MRIIKGHQTLVTPLDDDWSPRLHRLAADLAGARYEHECSGLCDILETEIHEARPPKTPRAGRVFGRRVDEQEAELPDSIITGPDVQGAPTVTQERER